MSLWLNKKIFSQIIEATPLVSIDLIVHEQDTKKYLLGFRNNRPAAHCWFVPGGRVLKNESLNEAFARITETELGSMIMRSDARSCGLYEHMYQDSVFGEKTSTHYIVLAHYVGVNENYLHLPSEQHSKYIWMTKEEIISSNDVHGYTKDYFR